MKSSLPESTLTDALSGPSPPPAQWTGGWPQSSEAFEAFVDIFQDRLVYYALRRLGNIQDAEDVIQEVFAKAFARRANYCGVERVAPYLYRMAANACTDHLRLRKGPALIPLDEIVGGGIPASGGGIAEAVAAQEEIRRIERTLGRLPRRQAEVIRLRVFDELPLADIAHLLGCSVTAVKSRLRYGLKKLRGWLARERKES